MKALFWQDKILDGVGSSRNFLCASLRHAIEQGTEHPVDADHTGLGGSDRIGRGFARQDSLGARRRTRHERPVRKHLSQSHHDERGQARVWSEVRLLDLPFAACPILGLLKGVIIATFL